MGLFLRVVWKICVLMEKRTHLQYIFTCILGAAAIIFLVYVNFETKSMTWDASGYRRTPRPPPPRPSPSPPRPIEPLWEDPGPYHVAYPRNYKFIMEDTPTCNNTSPFLVLMVPVAPANRKARDAIRKTWGSEKMVLDQLVETLFVVGLPGGADAGEQQEKLKQENLHHHDLIQSNFQDSYHNLTIKTMIILEWLAVRCLKASYVMKIDSDMFLHVSNLVKLLLDPNTPKQNYMTGLVWWHSPVLRNPFSKFYMPRDVVAEEEYPPYPLGMSYVISYDLSVKILVVSSQIKPLYIEDVYLGMCLKRLGVSPTDPPEDTMFIVEPEHPLSDCSLSKVIAATTTSSPLMVSYWQRSRHPEAKC
uniref:beta-1,3-galactosyltransferase 1-like isoform X2 n=1 Tax=Scatophagus argus TaxID=75038 RepID=UPI001ED81751|nr:beta-1,3-galactosyltransferase 1-like isoform X2 [Scatophagus argus]